MKAWLNGPVGIVPLSTAKPTTFGRECCDIIIPCPTVDGKHAIIEFDERGDCFILRDLNTVFGTYINGCQVCNATVRLTAGDVIKIGVGQTCIQYEFETDNTFSCSCSHHAAEMYHSSDVKERQPMSSKTCLKTTFPRMTSSASTAPSSAPSSQSVGQQGNSYSAYQTTSRPFSARLTSNSQPYGGSMLKRNSPGSNGQTYKASRVCDESSFGHDEVSKKDRKISDLTDEVHRLRKFEVENRHKDCRLKELCTQVECLQNQLSQAVSNAGNRIEVEALQGRVVDLENQIQLRTGEMAELNEQMFKLKTASQKQLNDKVLETNSLQEELERYRKDKNVLSGLLTQVQKDISMKDTTICRLTSDIDRKKNELSDKDVQIASFQMSFCVVEAHKQLESDLEKIRIELSSVEEKLNKSESSVKASEERYTSLCKALDKAKAELRQEKQHQKDLKKQLDELNAKQGDADKSNDALTQELRNLTSTLSRLRRRLQRLLSLRLLTNAKDVTVTDDEDELADDQIVSAIKEIIEDGNNLSVKLADLTKKCDDMKTTVESVRDCGEKLRAELSVSTGSVSPNPANMLAALRQELISVQSLVVQPVLHDFRDVLVSMIQVQLGWQSEMITTLEGCGFNIRLSDEGLVKHVSELHSKSQESRRIQDESRAKLEEATRQYRRDLEEARDRGRREVEERSREKIDRLAVESEMKIQAEKVVIEQKEKEIYEEKVSHERIKLTQLEECLSCLQKESAEKSEELNFYKQQEKQHEEEVESYRKLEAELRQEIMERSLAKTETRSSIEHSIRKKYEQEMATLREQSTHLSGLLASVQERLSKANNKIHRQQLEIGSLTCHPSAAVNVTNRSATFSAGGESVMHPSFEISRVNEKLRVDIRRQQAEIKKLSTEVAKSKNLVTEKDAVILRLEAQLPKAKEDSANSQSQSRISDDLSAVGAECKSAQHVLTISKQRDALFDLRKRIKDLQEVLAQSGMTEDEINELSAVGAECRSAKHALIISKQKDTLFDLQKRIKDLEEELVSQSVIITDESNELLAIGAECRDSIHVLTISKQRDALFDLRKRIKDLQEGPAQSGMTADESNTNTELTVDSANHHNDRKSIRLDSASKEMNEKTTVVVPDLSPDAPSALSADPVTDSLQTVRKSKVSEGQNNDLKENLEVSEQAYSSLLKAVTEQLPAGETAEKIPLLTDGTMTAERQEITLKRQEACEEITTELSVLRNKVTEYESTIEKYDQELLKLRTADVLLESKSWQIDGLTSDVRSLVDEVACLHESLTKAREELRKQKRLNTAARAKKLCGEKDKGRATGTIVKHTCFHNDSVYKPKERARSTEKPKRTYEMMMLKEEMTKCEKNMERARNVERLMADTDLIDEYIGCACSKTSI